MHLNANNNVYSNIFSTDQLINMNMNTFDAMYEDDHTQIEHFIPIVSSQDDLTPIMNENINIENELNHNQQQQNRIHNEFDNDDDDSSDSTPTHIINNNNNMINTTKNIANLNQILSLSSSSFSDDFIANNENLLHHLQPHAIKLEKINFNLVNNNNNNNSTHLKNNKVCDMINLNKLSNNQHGHNHNNECGENGDDAINFKLKDSSFGKKIIFG